MATPTRIKCVTNPEEVLTRSQHLRADSSMPSIKPGTVEPPAPISSLTNTTWTKPEYTLPLPSLRFLFHLECDMESFRRIGEGPYGDRSTVIFKGGRFEGPKMRGEILPGGGGTLTRNQTNHPLKAMGVRASRFLQKHTAVSDV